MANTSDNNTKLSAPTWLDNDFLETALRSGENNPSIKVISNEIKYATAAGDNYGSDMYRVAIQITREGRKEDISVIIKAAVDPTTGEMNKILEESDIFEREIDVFTTILPAMYRLLKVIMIDNNQPFAAKYLYSQQKRAIVLEDLKISGFILAESKFGLDLSHCLLVLRTIARFHAASMVLYHKNSENLKRFLTLPFSEGQGRSFLPMMSNIVENIEKMSKSWPEYKGPLSDTFCKLGETGMDKWLWVLENEAPFKVLIHGDLWTNNIMFRYSDKTGDVEDVRFVDFQMSLWTTPAVDLHYFLSSSASPDVLEEFDSLIEEYHSVLCETLVLLGYEHLQPTLIQLNEEIERKGIMGPVSAILTRPIALVDRNKVPDFNKVVENEEDIYLSEEYIATMKKLIPFFEKRSWI